MGVGKVPTLVFSFLLLLKKPRDLDWWPPFQIKILLKPISKFRERNTQTCISVNNYNKNIKLRKI